MRATLLVRASLICLLTLSCALTGEATISNLERGTLIQFFYATGGPAWSGNGGWGGDSGTECSWTGVVCNQAGDTVIELNLGYNNLVGTLLPQLGQLTNLEVLYLPGNALGGTIPSQLGSLSKLRVLDLNSNQLTGPIPSSFASLANLEMLALWSNQLTGTIPASLGSLSKLNELRLSTNRLSGAIPAQLAQLSALVYLDLADNALTGGVPAQLGSLAQLQELTLGINKLSGSIPPELGNLPKLRVLDIGENELTGAIPGQFGQLAALEQLQLHDNALTGSIPSQLGNLTKLTRLWLYANSLSGTIPVTLAQVGTLEDLLLAHNQLTGTIPAELGAMPALQNLQLNNNQLTGTIPTTLANAAALRSLFLSANQLTGTIPTGLGNLSNLTELDLGENQLSGTIPVELGSLTNLTFLSVATNRLTGGVPPELGNLTKMIALWAQGNQLTGAIPSRLGNLTAMSSLFLFDNQLTGTIPRELGQCTALEALDFGVNQLTGTIPPELGDLTRMQYFGLSSNQLTGAIPVELARMTSVINFDVSANRLNGTIPPAFGSIATLEFFALQGNELTGPIPSELAQASSLQYLFLSGNHLTGTIPPQLGILPNLRSLSIGQNLLSGSIPPQLGQLATLEELQLDLNNLSGPVPPELLNLTALVDNESDFGYNALYTNDPTLLAFLDRKEGASFRETQTVTVTNAQIAAVKSDTVVLTWQPIAYFNDPGGYAISVSTTPGGAPVQVVTTPDKQLSSFAVDGLTPQTTYYFVVTSVSYPFYLQQNTVISEPTATLTATTTTATISPPLPVVTTYPAGLVASAGTAGAEDYYQIRNYGDLPTDLVISQSGDFFTQSPTTATLGPDEELYVEIRGLARPAGAYAGTVLVTGSGFSNTVRIPVKMLSAAAQEGTALADASEDRIDVAAPANESPSGAATFTNLGNGTLQGIVVSDVGFIVPQSGLVTIAPGQSVPVSFQIDRAQRPDAAALAGTAAGTLSLVYATGGAAGRSFTSSARRGILDSPGVSVSLVTIADTVKPGTSSSDVPALGPSQVALLIPGVGHIRGGVGLFLSDVTITNVFGVSALADLSMYFSPSMDAPPASKSAPLAPVAPGLGVKLADIVTTVFGGDQVTGTLQIRTRDFDKIYTAANIVNVSNPLGTYGTVIPVFRSDRSLAAGQSLYLTGMRKSATTRTNIFVQETAGGSASVTVRFYAANGTEISSLTDSVTAFRMLRLLDRAPAGTVLARVTNNPSSSGRIVAYATPVDQESGDFWSIADWSQLLGANRAETVVIPVAGVVRGANDNFFRTEVSLSNVDTIDATGTLQYFQRDGVTFSKPVALKAGESIEYLDVVGSLFGAASGSLGYIVYTPEAGSVAATSRTYATVGTRPGTYGTGVPALPRSSAMRLGQSRQINGLEVSSVATILAQKPASFRSNIGLVETGGATARVRVTASYGDSRSLVRGPIASFDIDLPARGFVLLSDLSSRLPATARGEDLLGVSLRFQIISGDGAVIPFVTSVDNGSGDQVLRTE
ncbi:MAG: hypothetical protein NDJ92_03970 [Thermoanaerobaculia bacterium]|nr:hypothetical protein [Thermoanaerobaculia bacterium]